MKFHPTATANLLRADNGTYYARVRHLGKQHWKTLNTKTVSVARQRLRVVEEEVRGRKIAATDRMTVAQAADTYAANVATMTLAESSKKSRTQARETIRRAAPGFEARDVRTVTETELKTILSSLAGYTPPNAKKARAGKSATTHNRAVAWLRAVLDVAREAGHIGTNPAANLTRKASTKKQLALPSREQFAAIVAHVRDRRPTSADLVEGLAYCGARIAEARALDWADVDLGRGQLWLGGTKTATSRRWVPLNSAMRELLERLGPKKAGRVFDRDEAERSITNACAAVGVKRITHHDLRHLFATTCIESGVDIPTVAGWLGHSDGGALAMKVYGHLRAEHSAEAAAKVRF